MKKVFFCVSLVLSGLMTSCVEKHELVDEDSMPSWLGGSIYSELRNPSSGQLKGTFSTYLQLIQDLGYTEELNRTGSVTVFPANDDAFTRFFQTQTDWKKGDGSYVRSYSDLSEAQKKQLLLSSMLGNALLTNMLSNIQSGNTTEPGRVMKHETRMGLVDSVTTYPLNTAASVYPNNPFWTGFTKGVSVVADGTTPMMIHFTPEFMTNNTITTDGSNSDFAILMGGGYQEGDCYVYRNRIVTPNVTCQNGYIHQVENVVVPPGNMAQMMKNAGDLTIISHLFDCFAVPYYDKSKESATSVTKSPTKLYHDWYAAQQEAGHDMTGILNPDTIYEVRYLSEQSQGNTHFNNDGKADKELELTFDPGWNGYYFGNSELSDIGALFIPNDEVFADYFINGAGKSLMDRYAQYLPVTRDNLFQNLDCIDHVVVKKLLSNMMQLSFVGSVPSKFAKIVDLESGDFMGLEPADMVKDANGNYDVRIANNGVIYVLKRVLSPNSYVAVSAPTLFNDNMKVIKWMIENKSMNGSSVNPYSLNLDFYAYLLAMKANFALFLPTDDAFDTYLVDPASLVQNQPYALHFYSNGRTVEPTISASVWAYDPDTHVVSDSLGELRLADKDKMYLVRSLLADQMNYCTIVLPTGKTLGDNRFYKTKHGGEVIISGDKASDLMGGTVSSGAQIGNITSGGTTSAGLPASQIVTPYTQENGHSYAIDHLIAPPTQSVYSVLKNTPQFSKFFEICEGLSDENLLKWALDFDVAEGASLSDQQQRELNNYRVFSDEGGNWLDRNVRFLNMYNYTVYVPNNAAVTKAQEDYGLPLWSEVLTIYSNDIQYDLADPTSKRIVREMLVALSDFVRYHFQNTSVYADNEVDTNNYPTFLVNGDQINMTLGVSGGNGKLVVEDASGESITVSADGGLQVNVMARDYVFSGNPSEASYTKPVYATSSSFAAIHEIDKPLIYNKVKDLSKGVK